VTSFDYATIAAVACPLGIVAIVVATVLILASKADDGPAEPTLAECIAMGRATFWPDDGPDEDEEPTGEIPIVVDPPVVPRYVDTVSVQPLPDGMVLFRGGAVHAHCLGPKLLNDAAPCAGCAVHLDHVLTGA
jgi:hypothetical protein